MPALLPRRRATTTAVATLLALGALTACAQEEPTDDPTPTSAPAPTQDDTGTTSDAPDDQEVTSAPDDQEATSAPDDATATSTPDDASQTSEAPATAAPAEPITLTATDDSFTLSAPEGWEDALDLVDDENILAAAKATEQVDDFYTNVVVTKEEYVRNLTGAVEETAAQLAEQEGVEDDYELLEPAEVDGNRAPGYTIVREVQGSTVHQTQRWISHDGTLYVVTFSVVESESDEAASVLDDMLASWEWQD
ncbi:MULTISPECIES: hypothetical protein [unclassified Ornithinimicrobium]|uniref:hypothetical protein n=1 Tax=unclassified Ornithinimicrobium TaxID=2615080 RepID=UPI0038526AA5